MQRKEFYSRLIGEVRQGVAEAWKGFETDGFGYLIKFYFDDPAIHYEVSQHERLGRCEVGLHFEADRETNASLLRYFDDLAIDLKIELGAGLEVEQWTKSWARVYELLPCKSLDEATLELVSQKLVKMINYLQPLLEEWRARGRHS